MAISPQPMINTKSSETSNNPYPVSRMSTMPVKSETPQTHAPTRLISEGSLLRPSAGGSMKLPIPGAPLKVPLGLPHLARVGGSAQLPVAVGSSQPPLLRGSFPQGSFPLPVAGGVSTPGQVSDGLVSPQVARAVSPRPKAGGSLQLPMGVRSQTPIQAHQSPMSSAAVPSAAPVQGENAEHRRESSRGPSSAMAERSRTQSPVQFRQLQPAWKAQLQEVRKALEEDGPRPTTQRGCVVQTLQNMPFGDDNKVAQKLESKIEQVQQEQKVQQADLKALERKVQEVNAREASQQAEQRLFLRTLRDEIIVLAQQVQSLREDNPNEKSGMSGDPVESEFDAPNDSRELAISIEAEFKQLRLDFDNKILEQEVQLKSWQAEVLQRLAQCVEESLNHHSNLITTVVSEVKGLRVLQGQSAVSTVDTKLAEIGDALQENPWRKDTSGRWDMTQGAKEDSPVKEDSMEAIKKSNALLKKTQADLSSLRDLLNKSTTQRDHTSQERYLGMIKCLEAEEADLKEVHTLLKEQRALKDPPGIGSRHASLRQGSEVAAVLEQPKDQVEPTVAYASMSVAASEVREAAAQAIQQSPLMFQQTPLALPTGSKAVEQASTISVVQATERPPDYLQNRLPDLSKAVEQPIINSGTSVATFNGGGYPAELLDPWRSKSREVLP